MYADLVADYARLLRDLATVSAEIIYDDTDEKKCLVDVLKDYFEDSTCDCDEINSDHVKLTKDEFNALLLNAKECILGATAFDFINVPYCATYTDENDLRDRIDVVIKTLNPLLEYIPYNKNLCLIRCYDVYNQTMHNVKVITKAYNEFSQTVFKDFQMNEDYDRLQKWLTRFSNGGLTNGSPTMWKALQYTCELLCKLNKFAIRLKTADCFHININSIGKCIYDSNMLTNVEYDEPIDMTQIIKDLSDASDIDRTVFIQKYDWSNYNYAKLIDE